MTDSTFTSNDNDDDDNDVLLLRAKIERLLSRNETSSSSERTMVAVLLLLRAPPTVASDLLRRHSWLVEWLQELLDEDYTTNNELAAVADLYVRLTAQLLRQAHNSDDSLTSLVVRQLERRCSSSLSISAVDLDLVSSLGSSLESSSTIQQAAALSAIWKRWSGLARTSKAVIASSDKSLSSSHHTWYYLLEKLLNQTTATASDVALLLTAWDDLVIDLLERQLPVVSQHSTSCFHQMLSWWLAQQQHYDKQHQSRIAALLLQSLIAVATPQQNTKTQLPLVQHALFQTAGPDILQLVQACLVSTLQQANDDLRVDAWGLLSHILTGHDGWHWLLWRESTADHRWTHNVTAPWSGSAQVCAMLRLASGEFRIQLGHRAPQCQVVLATSHIMVQCLEFMVFLLDSSDNNDNALDGKAISHIRCSFREGLDSCVQYICLDSDNGDDCTGDQNADILLIVLRLMAALLPEFMEFDGETPEPQSAGGGPLPATTTMDREPSIQALSAIRKALDFSDLSHQKALLLALLTVMTASDGDDWRVKCLREADLLGSPFVSFCCLFFKSHANVEDIDLAAQVIEQWYEIVTSSEVYDVSMVDSLQCVICDWIDAILSSKPGLEQDDFALATALGSAVACFVTLQGDSRPSGRPASIIERALKFCSIVQSETGFV